VTSKIRVVDEQVVAGQQSIPPRAQIGHDAVVAIAERILHAFGKLVANLDRTLVLTLDLPFAPLFEQTNVVEFQDHVDRHVALPFWCVGQFVPTN
jgi:hypothetical protein